MTENHRMESNPLFTRREMLGIGWPVWRLWPASQPVLFRRLRKNGLVSPVSSPIGLLRDHMRTGS